MNPRPALSPEEAFARIRLLRSPHVGPATYHQLLRRFGKGAAALAALPALAARGGAAGRGNDRLAPAPAIAAEIATVARVGARHIFHDSPDYPPLLRGVEGAPPILIARGRGALAAMHPVAVVGARNASAGAMRIARDLARVLVERGHTVVSGLARGIDTAAHQGALSATNAASGSAGTIAVIACGIDIAYPPQNAALQEEVAREGLLLSELAPGTGPSAGNFPARNRIIAALTLGTLVVEAAPGSGSLITARLAADYGREVMAVPGSPLDPRSRGANALIRDGAILVQDAEEVIEVLTSYGGGMRASLAGLDHHADHLYDTYTDAAPGGAGDLGQPDHAAFLPLALGRDWLPSPAPPVPTVLPTMRDDAPDDPSIAGVITRLLGVAPVAVDELVRQSGAATADVQMALIELELAGRLIRHAGGRVSLAG